MTDLFKRVVVAVDGSEQSIKAAEKAIYIAKNFDLNVLAIYVVEENVFDNIIPPDSTFKQLRSMLVDEGNKTLNKIVQLGKEKNVNILTLLLEGHPEVKIVEKVKKDDLIVVGNRGKTMIDRLFLGSTTENLLHYSGATVMVVK